MKLNLKALLLAVFLIISSTANAMQPSQRQIFVMKTAYQIAQKDGQSDPTILQGIVMVETKAGESMNSPNGSLGVSQILIGTAKYVLELFPDLSVEYFPKGFTKQELAKKLHNDDIFNLKVASKYLLLLKEKYKLVGDRLIAAYNRGPNGDIHNPAKLKYVIDVKAYASSELAKDSVTNLPKFTTTNSQ